MELRKIITLPTARYVALGTLAVTLLLAASNAVGYRAELRDGPVADLDVASLNSGLLCLAAGAAVGILVVGQEYRELGQEAGGSRQLTATSLAVGSAPTLALAKLVVAGAASAALAVVGLGACETITRLVLGASMPPLSLRSLSPLLGGVVYATLLAMLCAAVTLLLRNGLVPMVYGVSTSTVVSIGFLLAQRWRWAWCLPDAAGPALVVPGDGLVGMPSRPAAAAILLTWVLVVGAVAVVVDSRRGHA